MRSPEPANGTLEEPTHRETRTYGRWPRIARLLTLALLPLIAFSACSEDRVPDEVAPVEVDGEDRGLFGGDPAEFEGQQVILTAAVDEVVHPEVFLTEADGPNGDRYLVIHDGSIQVSDRDQVEITGRVEDLDIFELEEKLDTNLDMPTFEPYEGDYGIVAEEMEVLDA